VRRTAENKLKVVAVRVDPVIEQRLRILADATGRKQSFFLQQMIETGIDKMEETWLTPEKLEQVRSGELQTRTPPSNAISDLFGDAIEE
jgi:RHH-type transcriptional regulator, rel operon repressor / antitoxin RelB